MENLRNSVRLSGIVGTEPEVKTFSNNKRMARLRLGILKFTKARAEEEKDNVQWITLVFWNDKVELIENKVAKGAKISIEGRLQIDSYDKNGEKRIKTEVLVNSVVLE